MSDATQAALAEAVDRHALARAIGVDADEHEASRLAAEQAAVKHLAKVDPGYADRNAGVLQPDQRVVAPRLRDAYTEALEAWHADRDNPDLAAKASRLGEEFAAARTAQRVAEGRWEIAVRAEGGDT